MFTLDQVVPWGRSFDEYRQMFALTDDDLRGRVVGCGDGPASFNAGARRRGTRVVSVDPIYRWTADEIRRRIDETCDCVLEETRRNVSEFVWTAIRSVDELGDIRMAAMREFLDDYASGPAGGRYVAAALPRLPFANRVFDLALSSHFLFLYSAHFGGGFHLAAVREMCRVAAEVRMFPLLALGGQRSPYIHEVVTALTGDGFEVSIERVPYEFQRGGNQMMRIRPVR